MAFKWDCDVAETICCSAKKEMQFVKKRKTFPVTGRAEGQNGQDQNICPPNVDGLQFPSSLTNGHDDWD